MAAENKTFGRRLRMWWRAAKFAVIGRVVLPVLQGFLKLWFLSWRLEVEAPGLLPLPPGPPKPVAVAILHGCSFGAIGCTYRFFRSYGVSMVTMVSPSRDGQLIGQCLEAFGGKTVVGSSKKRGAAALVELIRSTREGNWGIIAVDGPRGPLGIPKPGIFRLAQAAGAELHVIHIAASPRVRLNSWDRATIFPPFARVRACFRPLPVERGESEEVLNARFREVLEDVMRRTGDDPSILGPAPETPPNA
jgi:lysophospholipid acyltransferase (LPLAT)-like uncharacterized protein